MKRSGILLCLALVALMLMSVLVFAACEEDGESVTAISSIEVKDGTVTLKATLEEGYASEHSKETLYILALNEMTPEGSLDGAEVVAEGKAKKSMTYKFNLYDDIGLSRVASAFVLAEKNGDKYTALTAFSYVSNPESLADKDESPASTAGIKGIESNDPVGLSSIGAEHMLVEADMGAIVLGEFTPDAIRFNYENVTYFYDKEEIDKMDKLVGEAEKAGMRVYIRTVLLTDRFGVKKNTMPDMSDAEVVRQLKAFYAFLASRYSVADYIIGDRVNDYGSYYFLNRLDGEQFEKMYSFWVRIANNILKSVNSAARVYVSVDNTWKSEGRGEMIGAQAFLSHFASEAKAGGDYNYAVALNLGKGEDLTALLEGENYNHSKIGAINLSEFADFIDKSEMRYKSEKRDMIIDGLEMREGVSSKNSAAYYTYAYYTAAEKGFNAFIYSGSIYGNKGARSDLYFTFMMCGSSMNSQLADYTDKLKGGAVPSFDEYISNNLTYVQSATTSLSDQIKKQQKAFPVSLSSFETVGSATNFQGVFSESGPVWLLEANVKESLGGIIATSVNAKDIVASGYIGITLETDTPHTLCVLMRNENGEVDQYTFLGETRVEGVERTYYFNLADFTAGVDDSDDVTIAICLIPDGSEKARVEIVDIALYGSSAHSTETTVIIIVVAVILAAFAGLIVLLVLKRKKKNRIDDYDDDEDEDYEEE